MSTPSGLAGTIFEAGAPSTATVISPQQGNTFTVTPSAHASRSAALIVRSVPVDEQRPGR
jgi:hypothetical protein